jgi:hypothetical protein
MKQLSELVSSILTTVESQNANQSTQSVGLMPRAGQTMTLLEQSRQQGVVDMVEVSRLADLLLSNSLWQTAPTSSHRAKRIAILTEAVTPASYEDAVTLIARFINHFPRKTPEEGAVIISDVAASCKRHSIGVVALAVTLTQIMESATAQNPFMPPSGEIIRKAGKKTANYKSIIKSDLIDPQ